MLKLHVFLADAAQADAAGKLSALGLGWRSCVVPLPAFVVVILLNLDLDDGATTRYSISCELATREGELVYVEGAGGPEPVRFETAGQAVRSRSAHQSGPSRIPLTVSIGPGLRIEPGSYQWRVRLGGRQNLEAAEHFVVREGDGA